MPARPGGWRAPARIDMPYRSRDLPRWPPSWTRSACWVRSHDGCGGAAVSCRPTSSRKAANGAEIADEKDGYAGPATVDGRTVQVQLAGHLDPIDGQYHWRGTVLEPLPAGATNPLTVTVGTRTASARFTERSQQGGYSIAGVGTPPFPR